MPKYTHQIRVTDKAHRELGKVCGQLQSKDGIQTNMSEAIEALCQFWNENNGAEKFFR